MESKNGSAWRVRMLFGSYAFQGIEYAAERSVVTGAPHLKFSADGLTVTGIHFRAGLCIERPSLTSVAAEIHSANVGGIVSTCRPANLRRHKENLTNGPRVIQGAAAPRFAAVDGAMHPTFDIGRNLPSAHPAGRVIGKEHRAVENRIDGGTACPIRTVVGAVAVCDSGCACVQVAEQAEFVTEPTAVRIGNHRGPIRRVRTTVRRIMRGIRTLSCQTIQY